MRYINNNGITSSTPSIANNVCDKNGWYVDMLEDGNWLVSKQDTKIGIFSDLEQAMFFFMAKTEPIVIGVEESEKYFNEFLEGFNQSK